VAGDRGGTRHQPAGAAAVPVRYGRKLTPQILCNYLEPAAVPRRLTDVRQGPRRQFD
jgi:hypothetical protein